MTTNMYAIRLDVTFDTLTGSELNGVMLDLVDAAQRHFEKQQQATNAADRAYYIERYTAAMVAHDMIRAAYERALAAAL